MQFCLLKALGSLDSPNFLLLLSPFFLLPLFFPPSCSSLWTFHLALPTGTLL